MVLSILCLLALGLPVLAVHSPVLLCTGCNKDYLNRTYLLYDGVHYDPLVFKQSDGRLKYKFSADDDQYTLLALNVAKEAHKVRRTIACIHVSGVSICVYDSPCRVVKSLHVGS